MPAAFPNDSARCCKRMETIYDPLRKKEVALTPEEDVRQWFITDVLHRGMGVPLHMMGSEVALEAPGGKRLRADIVVYGRGDGAPRMVVECKRPDVTIDQSVVDQAIRYHRVLGGVRWIVVTNGPKSFFFGRDGEQFSFLPVAPKWEEMQ